MRGLKKPGVFWCDLSSVSHHRFYQGSTPTTSVGLRVPVPHCELSLSGEGRVKCEQSVIKGYHCKLKEEMHVFKNSRCGFAALLHF